VTEIKFETNGKVSIFHYVVGGVSVSVTADKHDIGELVPPGIFADLLKNMEEFLKIYTIDNK